MRRTLSEDSANLISRTLDVVENNIVPITQQEETSGGDSHTEGQVRGCSVGDRVYLLCSLFPLVLVPSLFALD